MKPLNNNKSVYPSFLNKYTIPARYGTFENSFVILFIVILKSEYIKYFNWNHNF